MFLSPALSSFDAPGSTVVADAGVRQVIWFCALGAAVLVLAGARRKWLAFVPGAVAVVAIGPFVKGLPYSYWQPDEAALELICTGDSPEV